MVRSPDHQPLYMLTDQELRTLAIHAAKNRIYSLDQILAELTYREQRRLSRWVVWLIAGTLVANLLGIALRVVL